MTNGAYPVPQETVEAGALNSVAQNMENWLQLASFQSEDWTSHREIWAFFGSYLAQYGALPSSSQISSRFHNWQPPVGDFRYWLAEMRRYSMARRVLEAVQEGYQAINDPHRALNLMLERLSLIRSQDSNHIQATDSSALTRLEKFDTRTELVFSAQQILGLRTGHRIFDDTLVGWLPGSMIGCFARPGVGKTWWLMWQGMNCWQDGGRVLSISPEMPANMLDLRVDVLAGNMLHHPIDYNKLLVGDPSVRANYELVTNVLSQSQRWWSYDSLDDRPIGLGDIAALVRQHEPNIVLIDGVSLLRSESRGQTWEQMKEICYGVKNLATIYEIPFLVTHQAVNSARGRRTDTGLAGRGDDFIMPSLNDAAFGDAFVQACSDVLTMCGEPTSQYINWYSIRKHRERGWRQPLPPRMALAVDFSNGRIFDLSDLGYDVQRVGEAVRQKLGVI